MSEALTTMFGTNSLLVGTLIPFLFVLTVVVFVHEMGHYLVGRWCGIGVKAFSIGFGAGWCRSDSYNVSISQFCASESAVRSAGFQPR